MYKKSLQDSVRTPDYILEWITKAFPGDVYDPVPLNPNFDPLVHKDALTTEWGKVSFANVPFSQAKRFVKKGFEQYKKNKTIILLVKTSVLSTLYFPNYVGCEIVHFPGRVVFPGHSVAPRFGVCLLIYRAGETSSKYSFFKPIP